MCNNQVIVQLIQQFIAKKTVLSLLSSVILYHFYVSCAPLEGPVTRSSSNAPTILQEHNYPDRKSSHETNMADEVKKL